MKSVIAQKIKQRRLELEISQEQLALLMGYTSRSTINKIEMGINDISQSKIVKFARVLNTTPSYLMGWEEKKTDTTYINSLFTLLSPVLQDRLMGYAEGLVLSEYGSIPVQRNQKTIEINKK